MWTAKNEAEAAIGGLATQVNQLKKALNHPETDPSDREEYEKMLCARQDRLAAIETVADKIPDGLLLEPRDCQRFRNRLDNLHSGASKLSAQEIVDFAKEHGATAGQHGTRSVVNWFRRWSHASASNAEVSAEAEHAKQVTDAIRATERYRNNALWGEARSGHAEGTIAAHINELMGNLMNIQSILRSTNPKEALSAEEVAKLTLLVHVHDICKGEAKQGVGIFDPKSHATLAKEFLREFLQDDDLLEMVQRHDEPFALARGIESKKHLSVERFNNLVRSIQDWDLFCLFQIVDNTTPSKITPAREGFDSTKWILSEVDPLVPLKRDYVSLHEKLKESYSPR